MQLHSNTEFASLAVEAGAATPIDLIVMDSELGETARERDADLVTVGHSRHLWFERLFGRGLAERVVDRCPCRVVVVPLQDR